MWTTILCWITELIFASCLTKFIEYKDEIKALSGKVLKELKDYLGALADAKIEFDEIAEL